jgi:hypothetical protein
MESQQQLDDLVATINHMQDSSTDVTTKYCPARIQ